MKFNNLPGPETLELRIQVNVRCQIYKKQLYTLHLIALSRGDGVIIVQVLSAASIPIPYFVRSLFHIITFSRMFAIDNPRSSTS